MTNTLTISRETLAKCLRDALLIRFDQDSHVVELRSMLSASVVERQPEPVNQWSDDYGISWCDGNERSLQSARESGWKTRTLYSSAPELAELQAAIAQLKTENERLSGLRPDFPPRPPDGDGLPRYGLRWNGPQQPLTVLMDDGYWTPWHLAEQLQAEIERLTGGQGKPVAWRGINCYDEVVTDWIDGVPGPMVDLCGNSASYDKIEYAYTSPPAPVAVDERAEFEVWVRKELPGIVIDLAPMMGFYKGDDGPRLDDMFSTWQARACLDKVKEMNR